MSVDPDWPRSSIMIAFGQTIFHSLIRTILSFHSLRFSHIMILYHSNSHLNLLYAPSSGKTMFVSGVILSLISALFVTKTLIFTFVKVVIKIE